MKTGERQSMWHRGGEEIQNQFGFEQGSWACRGKNNSGLKVIECEDVDRIQLAQNGDRNRILCVGIWIGIMKGEQKFRGLLMVGAEENEVI